MAKPQKEDGGKAKPQGKKRGRKPGVPDTSPEVIAKAGEMFRSGIYNRKEICSRLGVSIHTLRSWEEKYKWEKDLSDRVRKAVQRKVMAANAPEVINGIIDEDRAVEEAAAEQFAILNRQKHMLNRGMNMIDMLQAALARENEEDMAKVEKITHINVNEDLTLQQAMICQKLLQDIISKNITDARKVWKMEEKQDNTSIDEMQEEALRLAGTINQ